jgi:hypothetical protein
LHAPGKCAQAGYSCGDQCSCKNNNKCTNTVTNTKRPRWDASDPSIGAASSSNTDDDDAPGLSIGDDDEDDDDDDDDEPAPPHTESAAVDDDDELPIDDSDDDGDDDDGGSDNGNIDTELDSASDEAPRKGANTPHVDHLSDKPEWAPCHGMEFQYCWRGLWYTGVLTIPPVRTRCAWSALYETDNSEAPHTSHDFTPEKYGVMWVALRRQP